MHLLSSRFGVPLLSLLFLVPIGVHAEEIVDFSELMTPTCEIAGLVAVPPDGWFNVPFQNPPAGHLGCQMMRTDERDALVGIIRVRSVTGSAKEFDPDEYDGLLANEVLAIGEMGYRLDEQPLWVRRDVPVSGAGFRDGRAIGFEARIEGNDVTQEVHILVFRTDGTEYLVSLLTPSKAYDEKLYQRNLDSFGKVIQTFRPSGQ